MPLLKIDELVHLFLSSGWIRPTKHCCGHNTLSIRAELLVMACLHVLGLAIPFRALSHNTNISTLEHCKFFHTFITKMHSVCDNYIYLPKNQQELDEIMDRYNDMGLPGCGGLIDVIHVKWSQCPAGDANCCKGKESYPLMAWEVISDNTRKIIGISYVQFGTRNDKHIVKIDKNVAKIRDGWFR